MIHSQFLEACLDNEIEIVRALLAEDVRLVNSLSEDCRYSALAITVPRPSSSPRRSGDAASINVNQTNLTKVCAANRDRWKYDSEMLGWVG